ncbi:MULTISPECIES: tail fiber domain-containing protein [unclassified Nostoc]|uniref:tail fiber domain-containing protein n=1 Tax=unclassified Nostoc TaxID=2593658 RepID=UPI002AD29DE0|nr:MULTISPECIES: tail fiber domain-containing protein [unclassified Nostoc]MDZ8124238.1 tail fiber domain-containing protein [Nostoc sp. CmiVER01]MDZ8224107.1 tail fiber domain-containing protein [Nostoc sp. ChiVER01]
MTDKFSRSQILKASGAFIAGAAAAKGLPLVVGNEPAQAQTIGTFAEVRVASSNNPQVTIVQTNNNDFARLRFSTFGKSAWDIATGGSNNVMNFFNPAVRGNVMTLTTTGNLSITGVFAQGSSRELKENITELSSKEALETLANLSPVKFKYKADTEKVQHVGFIAEDVPELVATPDRKRLSSMDIVGVLTKVVQEQQQTILALAQKVKALEKH